MAPKKKKHYTPKENPEHIEELNKLIIAITPPIDNDEFMKYMEHISSIKSELPNIRNSKGQNMLMISCYHNNNILITYLLQLGIDINEVDNEGKNALFYVTYNKSNTKEILFTLFANGINIFQENKSGENIFQFLMDIRKSVTDENKLILEDTIKFTINWYIKNNFIDDEKLVDNVKKLAYIVSAKSIEGTFNYLLLIMGFAKQILSYSDVTDLSEEDKLFISTQFERKYEDEINKCILNKDISCLKKICTYILHKTIPKMHKLKDISLQINAEYDAKQSAEELINAEIKEKEKSKNKKKKKPKEEINISLEKLSLEDSEIVPKPLTELVIPTSELVEDTLKSHSELTEIAPEPSLELVEDTRKKRKRPKKTNPIDEEIETLLIQFYDLSPTEEQSNDVFSLYRTVTENPYHYHRDIISKNKEKLKYKLLYYIKILRPLHPSLKFELTNSDREIEEDLDKLYPKDEKMLKFLEEVYDYDKDNLFPKDNKK